MILITRKKRAKAKPPVAVFSITRAREFVADALSRPLVSHTERVEGIGELIASFVLPLDVCPTTNSTRHEDAWKHAKVKQRCFLLMRAQCLTRTAPLAGRPHVRCIRFSSVECDAYADFAKIAIDHLRVTRTVRGKTRFGLGFLVDDSPRYCHVTQHWENAPRGHGVVLIEVRTGAQ